VVVLDAFLADDAGDYVSKGESISDGSTHCGSHSRFVVYSRESHLKIKGTKGGVEAAYLFSKG